MHCPYHVTFSLNLQLGAPTFRTSKLPERTLCKQGNIFFLFIRSISLKRYPRNKIPWDATKSNFGDLFLIWEYIYHVSVVHNVNNNSKIIKSIPWLIKCKIES